MKKSLEDEMADLMAKDIAKEIDDGIMASILVQTGWISVQFFFTSNQQAIDITNWLDERCPNKWTRLGSDFLFENKQDAEWFILRWQ